jgi:hypothetical protein
MVMESFFHSAQKRAKDKRQNFFERFEMLLLHQNNLFEIIRSSFCSIILYDASIEFWMSFTN